MSPEILVRLRRSFIEFSSMVAKSTPAFDEIQHASSELGVPFSTDYVEFLREFGGGVVGAYPIFGLRPVSIMGDRRWSVVEITKLYRQRKTPGANNWAVISEDHAGNPIGLSEDGTIWIYDHDFGGVEQIADSFENYLRDRCLKLSQ